MKYKLVCFDLDGTIIDQTIFIWDTIHDFCGVSKEARRKAFDDFTNKKISYDEWYANDRVLLRKANCNKDKLFEAIKPLRLIPGALETLKELKKKGLKIAVISGSLDIVLEYLIPDYKEIFDDIFINKMFFDKEGNISGGESTPFDFEHKATALKKICKREGISPKECVFVGDNHNDVHIAELAGLSIAFNCKSETLAEIADVVIEKKDLRETLKHII
ncbi:HAD-IB family phosphatase [Candidatus Woesearchaeota archaeon]|nr:HAD-IB family phosphatase [Candidatus Woesearchaeota archaeon]